MKTPTNLSAALLGLLVAAVASMPFTALAQTDTGGTGTIDPNTVAAREVVRDSTFIENSNESLDARYFASDAAGNFYVGTVVTYHGSVGTDMRSAISKYAPDGTLQWRHEGRTVNDFKAPSDPAGDDHHNPLVLLTSLSADSAGNVALGFNLLTSVDLYPYTLSTANTLLVGYDPSGGVRWRDFTGKDPATTPNPVSKVQNVIATPDGGALALLTNSSGDPYNTVNVVRLAADGTEKFDAVFGTGADGLDVLPTSLADDGNGNAYLLTREGSRSTGNAGLSGSNVARRLGPTGAVLAQLNASAADSKTDTWVQAKADSSGRLYIAGSYFRNSTTSTSNDSDSRQLLLAFNLDLSSRWRAFGPTPAHADGDVPKVGVSGLRLSPGGITMAGNADVGTVYATTADQRWEVTRFAYADGAIQWHRLYQGADAPQIGSRVDALQAFQVDAADNVYAAGTRSVSAGGELVLIKYSGVGDTQFIKPFPAGDQHLQITYGNATDEVFQLAGTGYPALLSPVGGLQAVVLTFDNPAVVPAASQHAPFFSGEVALSNGVYYLAFAATGNPFGYYAYLSDPRYIYHFDMGYEYWFDAQDGKSGVYLYDFESGTFFYTSPSFPFPYLYDFSLNTVLYYYPDPNNPGRYNTNGTRYFFRYDTGQIVVK